MEKETNLKHYLPELKRAVQEAYGRPVQIFDTIQKTINPEIKHNNSDYTSDILEWMAQEYREPLLEPEEKKYLSEVIRPFRKEVESIRKLNGPQSGQAFIKIQVGFNYLNFPGFERGTRYKGMEYYKAYKPEELGL